MMNIEDASDYLDALAERLGANPEMRRKWRERERIAATWHSRLMFEAAKEDVELPPAVFSVFVPSRRKVA